MPLNDDLASRIFERLASAEADAKFSRAILKEIAADVKSSGLHVTELQTKMADIYGNGQRGRMKDAEDRLAVLEAGNNRAMGMWAAASMVVSAGVSALMRKVWP